MKISLRVSPKIKMLFIEIRIVPLTCMHKATRKPRRTIAEPGCVFARSPYWNSYRMLHHVPCLSDFVGCTSVGMCVWVRMTVLESDNGLGRSSLELMQVWELFHLIPKDDSVPLCLRKSRPGEHDLGGTHCLSSYIHRWSRRSWGAQRNHTRSSGPPHLVNKIFDFTSVISPSRSPINPSLFEIAEQGRGQWEVPGWEKTQKAIGASYFSSICLLTLGGHHVSELSLLDIFKRTRMPKKVCTRFSCACFNSAAPRPRSYWVEALYLNVVLGPGTQAVHSGISAVYSTLHILCSVLPLTICPPHTQPVPHRFWAAVVFRCWKRLKVTERKKDMETKISVWCFVGPSLPHSVRSAAQRCSLDLWLLTTRTFREDIVKIKLKWNKKKIKMTFFRAHRFRGYTAFCV